MAMPQVAELTLTLTLSLALALTLTLALPQVPEAAKGRTITYAALAEHGPRDGAHSKPKPKPNRVTLILALTLTLTLAQERITARG